jgi:uncharacterized protein (DUF302 family)
MYKVSNWLLCVLLLSSTAMADNGLMKVKSAFDVKTTSERLEKILTAKGMQIFAHINHAQAAEKIGKTLRPTRLIIFGNPKIGSIMMQCQQTIAIDLPQKALIWQDAAGQTWLSYNKPQYLAKRHALTNCDKVMQKVSNVLAKFAQAATSKATVPKQ